MKKVKKNKTMIDQPVITTSLLACRRSINNLKTSELHAKVKLSFDHTTQCWTFFINLPTYASFVGKLSRIARDLRSSTWEKRLLRPL